MRTASLCAPLAALLMLVGCDGRAKQSKFDDLHPVAGTISAAGKPVSGGTVRFMPDPDKPDFLINSEVGTDGRFKLTTVRTNDSVGERKPGAPAGKYKVTYTPSVVDQTSGYKAPVTLPAPVSVEAKDNDLKIQLPKR